jgi:para-aminobenzoate synthetase component 1
MKPVICFYKNQQAIYSDDYILKTSELNIFEFLADIEWKFSSEMKIVQIDFEATSASVFILNTYQILPLAEIQCSDKINLNFQPAVSKKIFAEKVSRIKKYISEGRIYQVNLTSRFRSSSEEDSLVLFKKYFSIFKSEYFAFLPLEKFEILCYSPELFLEKINSKIRTLPIKGTLTSGLDDLMTSEKEKAELSMIVDLLRNDLNSVCEVPVTVKRHRDILDLGYTQHTYSEIIGHTQKTFSEILISVFPGGSVSGCPKIESLKVISELEDCPRGFYTGSIGWWQNDDFKLNIAIRSFKKENLNLTYYAGCGIVYDSDPEIEWQEFLTKAGKLNIQSANE